MKTEQDIRKILEKNTASGGNTNIGNAYQAYGELNTKGDGLNTDDGAAEAAKRARKINTPEVLRQIAFDQDTFFATKVGRYRFALIRPTSPYTPGSMMLIAHPENLDEVTEPQYIYNAPAEIQKAYWSIIGGLIESHYQVFGDEHQIMYIENVVPTTGDHRTSRTLDLVHGQPVRIVKAWIRDTNRKLHYHLIEESEMTTKILDREYGPLEKLRKLLDEQGFEDVEIEMYHQPAGYAFKFPEIADRTELANLIQQVMELHWHWYKNYAQKTAHYAETVKAHKTVELSNIIPGPSYRQFVRFVDGRIEILVSPEYLSHAGTMESMGVLLLRTPEGEEYIEPEEAARQEDALTDAYAATIPPWIS